jgi:hypothetical protein
MALLGEVLQLLDVRDVEAFAGRIVERYGRDLNAQDRDELAVWLVEECWILSTKHDASKGPFSKWVGYTLARRTADWRRQRFGRTRWKFAGHEHVRERPTVVSLDDERDRLGESLAAGARDSSADWEPAFGGLFHDRDRFRARDLALLGLGADC